MDLGTAQVPALRRPAQAQLPLGTTQPFTQSAAGLVWEKGDRSRSEQEPYFENKKTQVSSTEGANSIISR